MNNTRIKTPRAAFGKLLLNESRLAWRIPIGHGSRAWITFIAARRFRHHPWDEATEQRPSAVYRILPFLFRYSSR